MKSCGAEATEADATSFIQSVDVNGNGTIEFWEVLTRVCCWPSCHSRPQRAFDGAVRSRTATVPPPLQQFVKMMGRKNQKRHHTMQMDSHEAKRRR